MNEALRDWVTNVEGTYYCVGSAAGPHPYPTIVRDFQAIIGREVRRQLQEAEGCLPNALIACVGGGSNSIGLFYDFLEEPTVRMIGVEAGGLGLQPGSHAVRFAGGRVGVVEGYKSYFLQDDDGQVQKTHSISAGLDYAGIGPFHAYLKDIDRVEFHAALDDDVIEAFKLLARTEGILGALESCHAIGWLMKNAADSFSRDEVVVVNLSGRADKDIFILADAIGDPDWKRYCADYAAGKIQ